MSTQESNAFFVRDGDLFRPTEHSRGAWVQNSLQGRVIAGLMGHCLEEVHGDPDFLPTRLTSDMFRMPPMTALRVETELIREGGRIRVADATLFADDTEIARGRLVMLRRTERPPGDIWTPPDWDVPAPESIPARGGTPHRLWDMRILNEPDSAGNTQRRMWMREIRPLVEGVELTPFVRCAVASDIASPLSHRGTDGLYYVNADITLYLHRLPQSDWLGFEVTSHQDAEGVAVGETTIYDVKGAIGKALACAVANRKLNVPRERSIDPP